MHILWFIRRAANRIGHDSVVRGSVSGAGSFRIDGRVEGNVETDGPVVVGERGSVVGDVRGASVVVLGQIEGNVHASGELRVGPKGKLVGDAHVASFQVAKGGTFRGATSVGDTGALPDKPEARMLAAVRGRTLPPPNGQPVPPPALRVMTPRAPSPSPSPSPPAASEERLVAGATEDAKESTATG